MTQEYIAEHPEKEQLNASRVIDVQPSLMAMLKLNGRTEGLVFQVGLHSWWRIVPPVEIIKAWIEHGSGAMVRRYLRPQYRSRVLASIPSVIGNKIDVFDPLTHEAVA